MEETSKHGQNLDSGQHNSIDGVLSPDQMESLDDADGVDHNMSSADRNGQFLVIKAETESVFLNQDGKSEFVDQSSSQNKELSFVSQGISSQDNELSSLNEQLSSFHNDESSYQDISSVKDEPVSMFQSHEQPPPETQSSLQDKLAALRSFKVPSKRTELTLQEKVDLLNHSQGKNQRQHAQVQTILKRRSEILKAFKQNCVSDRKRFGKCAENYDVNKLTWEWFQEMSKTQGVQVNGPMLQEQAKQFAKQLGRTDFKASDGWLSCFRKRHNIQSSKQGWRIRSGLDRHVNRTNSAVSSRPRNSDSKVKRVELTLQEKVELLRIHHQNGKSQRELAKMFGISKTQTRSILKRKDEILDQYENNGNVAKKQICRRTSVVENNDVDRLTLEWFNEVSKLGGVAITGTMVQKKAKQIAAELGRTDFKASNCWLVNFQKRYNIEFFFSKNVNNSSSEEVLEEIAVRLPSSFNTSVDNLHSEPDVCRNLRSSSELDILGTIKKEPEDVSEKPGCSEPASQPRGHKHTLPDIDNNDDDEDSDSDSESKTDAEEERTASTLTHYISISGIINKHKPVPVDKKKESVLQRSSVETIQKAAVMAKKLKLFCEDNSLTQLSGMLDFVERQLQMKDSDTSHNQYQVM